MPKHNVKKNGSVKKSSNRGKQSRNVDPALRNFSSFNGIVVDFQKLFNYQPPVLPIYDVRLIDRFNPTVVKYEYVMVKIGEEFHSMDYCVKRFTNFSLKLAHIFQEVKCLWELPADYVQKRILQAYDRLPDIDLPAAMYMKDPCMLDFMTLTIAIKYATILKTYRNPIREQILQRREPILRDIIQESGLDGSSAGLQFYEWFLSLMRKYADNNEKLNVRRNFSNDSDLSVPYILPFVGVGTTAEFYTPEAICRTADYSCPDDVEVSNSDDEHNEDEEDVDDERDNTRDTLDCEAIHATEPLSLSVTEQPEDSISAFLHDFCDASSTLLQSDVDKLGESKTDLVVYNEDPRIAEKIQREAAIMNHAFVRFFRSSFDVLTSEQLELADAVRSATVFSIKEMSNYLGNPEMNLPMEQYKPEEWELLCHYVRICYRVLVGEGECEQIHQATDKRQLNELRLSFIVHYETKRMEEIQENVEIQELYSQILSTREIWDSQRVIENQTELFQQGHNEYALIRTNESDNEIFEPVMEQENAKVSLSAEEIRMMKLYKKCCRPGCSTDIPIWDIDDSEDDDY